MKLKDLSYSFPEDLIAQVPMHPPRVMWVEARGDSAEEAVVGPIELNFGELLDRFRPGDVLVINDTKVLKRRIFAADFEILFLGQLEGQKWQVLFPSKKVELGSLIELPEGRKIRLLKKGRPQIVELAPESGDLSEDYFERNGELPLPPYIQKARGERHEKNGDKSWYQTAWAGSPGSLAAPTASLHFTNDDLKNLEARGVRVLQITLHVGLGTFLPITVENLEEHVMHEEWIEIPHSVIQDLKRLRGNKESRVWALGTTVARSLESWAAGMLSEREDGSFAGFSKLFIRPGFEFKVITGLLTNFHQPESTLITLVAAFSSLEKVKACYDWAIQHRFRLFSYGDLTVWIKT